MQKRIRILRSLASVARILFAVFLRLFSTSINEILLPQDISLINIFSFVNLKNELLAFLGWPYYILERLTILYAMFNFLGFLFSLSKGIYKTCAMHTPQVNKQAIVARILFAVFLRIFSTSINEILLDAQIKKYNNKLSTKPNTYDDSQKNSYTTPTASQLENLNHNYPLSLVPQTFRNIALTDLITLRSNYPQSPIQQNNPTTQSIEDTYEQIIDQPHTTKFCSQNNHLFSPR